VLAALIEGLPQPRATRSGKVLSLDLRYGQYRATALFGFISNTQAVSSPKAQVRGIFALAPTWAKGLLLNQRDQWPY
jgi:hypothetical protein